MKDSADFFPNERANDKDFVTRTKVEDPHPSTSIYFAQGPRRISEPDYIKKDREINKHQEKVTHNDICRCKQYEFNDLVVMYEHIEQYPQFRCYCHFCLLLLSMQCDKDIPIEDANHAIRFQLAGNLLVKKGIDLR